MTDNPTSLAEFFKLISEEKNKLSEEQNLNKPQPQQPAYDPMDRYVQAISGSKKQQVNEQQDYLNTIDKNFVTFDDLRRHYQTYIERMQVQLASLGGGGEVKFLRLDDVDASTVGPNKHLAYDPTTKKVFFEEVSTGTEIRADDVTTEISNNIVSVINLPANTEIGPITEFLFDTTHNHTSNTVGVLCWDSIDDTLNINHSGGVVQQVGQELYAKVRNNTGNTIPDGTVVRFDGAEQNGEARLEIAPFEADGTFPSLYGLGIATQNFEDGADGRVTVWGKVRNIDTTGQNGETWNVGDILYVSPTIAGGLTKVKPTAPNNVIPVAAVLTVNATEGELFVRPTIEQQESYGRFERTTDLAVTQVNTANVVQFDTTEISNGVEIVSGNTSRLQVNQSGLYQIDVSAQIDIAGGVFNSGTMYVWLRKNGSDVADSTRRQGIINAAPSNTLSFSFVISLDADDYIEIAFAGDDTELLFDASSATSFAPSTAAMKVGITQLQL